MEQVRHNTLGIGEVVSKESPEGNFRLISLDYRPDDMYATYAPAIRIVEGWERIKP